MNQPAPNPQTEDELLDDLYSRTDELVDLVRAEMREGKVSRKLRNALQDLHAADCADLVEHLSADERDYFLDRMGQYLDGDVLANLDETVREDVLGDLDTKEIADFVQDLDSDDAIEIIESLEEDAQRDVLDAVSATDRAVYEESLAYPEGTAGRIMQRETITVPQDWTVGDTIDFTRKKTKTLPERFYNITMVDESNRPVGIIPLATLLRNKRRERLSKITDEDFKTIPATMEQGDVAYMFRQYALTEAPVVDEDGIMLGVIDVDDIVDILDEEHEDSMLHLGGVAEDDFYSDALQTATSRIPWLAINLATAILASVVIGLFSETLEQAVALAILMPIVASMGGNAGTQTLTVAVRALATNELTNTNALRIVGKETLVGGINGIVFAILSGIVAWVWFSDGGIGWTIAISMVANLIMAGLAGVLVPLALDRLDYDPAISSTVFVTTVTDVVGFFTFLFMATIIL